MNWVERYRQNRWPIVRTSTRAMHRFAIMFVISAAAGLKRDKFAADYGSVLRKIYKVRRLWFSRAKELMSSGLWTPGSNITKSSADMTARRCLFCRPSCVFYTGGNTKRLRPCQHDRFCPFCWARTAAFIYWNVRRYINTRRKTSDGEIVTCVVARQFVRADGFSKHTGIEPGKLLPNVLKLKNVIAAHREAYEKKTKALQRHTDGSMWTIVVEPTNVGWRVESRQFMMGRVNARLPRVEIDGTEVVYLRSAKITRFVASTKVLGRFVRYPQRLLTGYLELTAIALQANSYERLRRGTGRFTASGRSLALAYKKTVADARKLKRAGYEKESPQQLDARKPA